MTLPRIPQSNAPIMQPNGVLSWEWYRWLSELNAAIDEASENAAMAALTPAGREGNVVVGDVTLATTHDILKYDGTKWINSNTARLSTLSLTDGLILSGTSGEGVKVDVTTPTFGWHDMLGQIHTRGVGATDPAWTAYRGTISAYLFQVNDVAWCTFHMPHDYVPGSDLHLHIHWSHISAAVVSGAATWSFDVSYAKGHNQAAFSAPITATVSQNASTTQYQHMIAEVQISNAGGDASHIDRALLEVDGLILVRVTLTANTLNAATDVFGHMLDIHYQSTGCPTKNKAPSFYV